ncbi:MAG: hypothetical protein KGZ60_09720 [Truepera sp.]|nr:hypothetical protein [Truepera sp.]MBS3967516.1 hypothetical protein [Truepera sp.]
MNQQETKKLDLREERLHLTNDGKVVIDDPEIYEALRQVQATPTDEEGISFNFKCNVTG